MDEYHFYEEIGRGEHSVVFKGRRKRTIEFVTIKSVDKSEMARVSCVIGIQLRPRSVGARHS